MLEVQAELREGREEKHVCSSAKVDLGPGSVSARQIGTGDCNHPNRQLQAEPPVAFRMGVMNCPQTRLDGRDDVEEYRYASRHSSFSMD